MRHTDDHGGGDLHGHASVPDPNLDLLAKLGYDTRDIALKPLAKWLGAFAFLIVIATLIGYGLFKWLVPTYPELSSNPLPYVRLLPPNPQVQTRPRRDMIDYWARVDPAIKGYTAGDNGRVNLPIGRAMDLMEQKGISGVTGTAVAENTENYPGKGAYTGKPNPAPDFDANFEGGGTPNPFRDNPVPSPFQGYPAAPGATSANDGVASAPTGATDEANTESPTNGATQ